MNSQEIATTILRQLGGRKFIAMTGAKHLAFDSDGSLSFKLPKIAGLKINYVKIKLNEMDLYDMEFGQVKKFDYKRLETVNGVYFDQLQKIFTEKTKLYTHL